MPVAAAIAATIINRSDTSPTETSLLPLSSFAVVTSNGKPGGKLALLTESCKITNNFNN